MQKEAIKTYFHYNCKSDAIILDSQYTFQGNYLAVCTSNGSILIYKSPIEQTKVQQQDCNPVFEFTHSNKNNSYLKLAWSYFNSNVLVALSINRQISCFELEKNALKFLKSVQCESVPVCASYLPSFDQSVLCVGFADGSISLFNQALENVGRVPAHGQSVNWLSWERRLGISERNRWISEYYPNHVNKQLMNSPPLLASCSSDGVIKIWQIKKNPMLKLQQLHSFVAHNKEIRQVMWKPNYFTNSRTRNIVSCSEDGHVRFWEVSEKGQNIISKMKSQRNFGGPVYRAQYNSLGTLIAISYLGTEQGKVETKAFVDKDGVLGEWLKILQ